LILEFFPPYIYLNHELINAKGLDLEEVRQSVANEAGLFDDIAYAISASALTRGEVASTTVMQKVLNNHSIKRSGDIYVVFRPHSFISDMDGLHVAAHHGSPWSYDTFVPVIFAGNGLSPQRVTRRIHTVDIAPTMASWIGSKLPSGSEGELLDEVLQQKKD
jgi:hypothetical protein